jgi:excinuclease UvrABC nuclease subunit
MPFEHLIPRPFVPGAIQTYAPMASGVYGISNAREWIYIGEADDIRDALLTHLNEYESPLMKSKPAGFVFEVCDRARRSVRQDRLVHEYGPTCNRRSPRRA